MQPCRQRSHEGKEGEGTGFKTLMAQWQSPWMGDFSEVKWCAIRDSNPGPLIKSQLLYQLS